MGWILGLGNGVVFRTGSSRAWSSYWVNRHPELKTYITGLITPLSNKQIIRIGEFIEALKNGLSITNLSDAFDVMYILAGETEESSLKNLVKDSHHCSNVHSSVFVQYEGFTGDGANDYLNTNYNPSTEGQRFTQNNASIMVLSRTNISGEYCDTGSRLATTNYLNIFSRLSTDKVSGRLNDRSTVIDGGCIDSRGLFMLTRNSNLSTGLLGYRNKDALAKTGTTNSVTIPNTNILIGARAVVGDNPECYSPRQIAFHAMGVYMSTNYRDIICDALANYGTSCGKNFFLTIS